MSTSARTFAATLKGYMQLERVERSMKLIESYIQKHAAALLNAEQLTGYGIEIGGISRGALGFWAAAVLQHTQRSVLLVLPNNMQAQDAVDECALFLDASQLLFFPGYANIPYAEGGIDAENMYARVNCLDSILNDVSPKLICTSTDALLRRLPLPTRLYAHAIALRKNLQYAPLRLIADLIELGYKRVERVEAVGEVCSKGSIVDIYPVNMKQALRIDYFDDHIESLRTLDITSQRSQNMLEGTELSILACSELVLNKKESAELFQHFAEADKRQLKLPFWSRTSANKGQILTQLHHAGLEHFFTLVMPSCSLLDYFLADKAPILMYYPALEVQESAARIWREFKTIYAEQNEHLFCLEPGKLIIQLPRFKSEGNGHTRAAANQSYTIMNVHPYGNSATGIQDNSSIRGKLSDVRQKIAQLVHDGYYAVLSSAYPAQLRRMASFFRDMQGEKDVQIKAIQNMSQLKQSKDKKTLYTIISRQDDGFAIPELKFYFITDSEIFGRAYRRRTRSKRGGSAPIASFIDLNEGDYVVHLTHGVGRFIALEKVKTMGKGRDFLLLEYAAKDRLYVPLDQISLVQKYVAPTEKPRLDSLGKASFKKIKQRVAGKVQELAQELLRLQALRQSRKGYRFPPDSVWQEEFEAAFPYVETPDQLNAIEVVKKDMEATQPMDRLICGDVGYGKTEIAIRAIFKAVLAGRQVAFIAPTTILALQHYQTLQQRFADYPISVDWISRFRTGAEVRAIKAALKNAKLDVVVGTHALLSESIVIPKLGLLVIDEEQRFGVSHKEAIKRLRELVDVLTLSATPIPRTLHMSLIGIRELSIIETPPQERLAVQTYVMEYDDAIVRETILREKERQGQVFYLHNRINSIEDMADRILTLVPEARLAVLHGRMEDEEIEDTLLRFQEKKIDVLLTTTIIENGIDMPNVNTLIVDRAHTFGLSQLYQLRGRVGRSTRQGYAYFLYAGRSILHEVAQKRLNTILEYQELGSGFKVAMRDLEIRGAGNVLGVEQSGHIIDVGYELYLNLLSEAIQALRGAKVEIEQSCSVQLHTDFYIPDTYIHDVRQRIEFYKRFAAARAEAEITELEQEMQERFGVCDKTTAVFIQQERLRVMAQQIGLIALQRLSKTKVELRVGEALRVPHANLVRCLHENPRLSLRAGQNGLLFYQLQDCERVTEELLTLFEQLLYV